MDSSISLLLLYFNRLYVLFCIYVTCTITQPQPSPLPPPPPAAHRVTMSYLEGITPTLSTLSSVFNYVPVDGGDLIDTDLTDCTCSYCNYITHIASKSKFNSELDAVVSLKNFFMEGEGDMREVILLFLIGNLILSK